MIITQISGGLGNQMFQYAAGRSLAEFHGIEMKLDTAMFDFYNVHKNGCELKHFHITAPIATKTETTRFSHFSFLQNYRLINWLNFKTRQKWPNTKIYYEPHFHFDKFFFHLPSHIYLIGCWQSEKYFKNIKNIIRKEFTFKKHQTGKNKELSDLIAKTESVSLHIRRGDYLSAVNLQIHGICDMEYYKKALWEIEKQVKTPHFFVFSDDIAWAKENLKINHPVVFVDHNNSENNFEDMRLMSQCKHNIIANSSFSWWGAWLNSNTQKRVITPKKWVNRTNINTNDLIPPEWIRI